MSSPKVSVIIVNYNGKELLEISKDIDFAELCITSHAKIIEYGEDSIKIKTIKAKGNKCPVCWKIQEDECARHPKSNN